MASRWALRLLELCSGTQPYANDRDSWTTPRTQLGPTVIRVTGLPDNQTIVWRLNPDVWRESSEEPVGAWLGTVEIDGASARLEEAHRLLQVVHQSGDLTLEGTLLDRIARDRNAVSTIGRRFNDHEQRIGVRLDALTRDLARADYAELSSLVAQVDEARATTTEAAWCRAAERFCDLRLRDNFTDRSVLIAPRPRRHYRSLGGNDTSERLSGRTPERRTHGFHR